MASLCRIPLSQVHSSARWHRFQTWHRNIHIHTDHMRVSKILINVGRCHLSCRNGTNYCSRSCYTVSPANTPGAWVTSAQFSASITPRLMGIPASSKCLVSIPCPMATITTSHGMAASPSPEVAGEGPASFDQPCHFL